MFTVAFTCPLLKRVQVSVLWGPFTEQPNQKLGDGLAWASGAALLVTSQLRAWSLSLFHVL